MNNSFVANKQFPILSIDNSDDAQLIQKTCYALCTPERIKIFQSLLNENKSLMTLSQELNIPISSLSRHVDILADAGLINLNYQPGLKGHAKHCSLSIQGYTFSFLSTKSNLPTSSVYSVELPIGMFSHCHIERPCGMVSQTGPIGTFDSPNNFFLPDRINAECLWFDKGFISYNFPTPPANLIKNIYEMEFSFEICSETNCYNNNWPSDITIFINNVELATFISPGDFGGRPGKYTPPYWPVTSTQFGLLKQVTVNKNGVFIDQELVNRNISIDKLFLFDGHSIQLKIGIKDNATHIGGINLFGKHFGDYPQAIIMTLRACT